MRLPLIGCLILSPFLVWAAPAPKLDDVTVHLLYQYSGQLSPDVTSVEEFMTWNFVPFGVGIPEGEKVDSFLIRLAFFCPSERYDPGAVATVRLLDSRKRVVFTHTVKDMYFGEGRTNHAWVFVDGHVCEPLTLEVTSFGRVVKKDLAFNCGE